MNRIILVAATVLLFLGLPPQALAQATAQAPALAANQTDIAAPGAAAGSFTTGGLVANSADRLLPTLTGVQQLTVGEPLMVDNRNALDCKLDAAALRQGLLAALATEHLPVNFTVTAAGADQLTLRPQIATLKDGVVNCVSWVSLAVEQQQSLPGSTMADRKSLRVEYWSRGALILTPVVDHARGVADVLARLAHVLARQWRLDNPGGDANAAGSVPSVPATPALLDLKR